MTIEQQIADIKAHMPEVYKSIQAKAAAIGKPAFALVRKGLRGDANCFYAFERGQGGGHAVQPDRCDGRDREVHGAVRLHAHRGVGG